MDLSLFPRNLKRFGNEWSETCQIGSLPSCIKWVGREICLKVFKPLNSHWKNRTNWTLHIDRFLFSYRNAPLTVTGNPPSELLKWKLGETERPLDPVTYLVWVKGKSYKKHVYQLRATKLTITEQDVEALSGEKKKTWNGVKSKWKFNIGT